MTTAPADTDASVTLNPIHSQRLPPPRKLSDERPQLTASLAAPGASRNSRTPSNSPKWLRYAPSSAPFISSKRDATQQRPLSMTSAIPPTSARRKSRLFFPSPITAFSGLQPIIRQKASWSRSLNVRISCPADVVNIITFDKSAHLPVERMPVNISRKSGSATRLTTIEAQGDVIPSDTATSQPASFNKDARSTTFTATASSGTPSISGSTLRVPHPDNKPAA